MRTRGRWSWVGWMLAGGVALVIVLLLLPTRGFVAIFVGVLAVILLIGLQEADWSRLRRRRAGRRGGRNARDE